MPETFLILLAGGVMLAAAVVRPIDVTLQWLRLAGILALAGSGLALFFYFAGGVLEAAQPSPIVGRIQLGLLIATPLCILGQLAFAQVARRGTQRAFALAAFICATLAGGNLLHHLMAATGTSVAIPPKSLAMTLQTLACAGVAAATGLALMDMLLGHAYLTAARMTIRPFARLNGALAIVLIVRCLMAGVLTMALHHWRPVEMLWGRFGLFMLTRWAVGLLVPAVFVYMAADCIKRRSTQSATGILYVAGVLIFLGEMIALHLVRQTGLPF